MEEISLQNENLSFCKYRLNLGAFSQMDQNNSRPPACTLYCALAVEYITKNSLIIRENFMKKNTPFFQKMIKTIYEEGMNTHKLKKFRVCVFRTFDVF